MKGFLKTYILPAVVCIALTLVFWLGFNKVRSLYRESVAKDQLLGAVVQVINYNIQQGKLAVPPPEPPAKK